MTLHWSSVILIIVYTALHQSIDKQTNISGESLKKHTSQSAAVTSNELSVGARGRVRRSCLAKVSAERIVIANKYNHCHSEIALVPFDISSVTDKLW